ncbi:hypothetical protein [Micromonospora sp. CPCC 205556]|uniref:hypothetical protein n=1 Tax=Micromonospora sp. CPCC 205556 TaxID=3122398 RepID=UPI002FF0C8D5
MVDKRERYAEGVTRLLPAGERLRVVAEANVGLGLTPQDPPQPDRPEPGGGGPGLLGGLLNLLSPNITLGRADAFAQWLFFGVGGRGAPGTEASLLHHALVTGVKGPGLRRAVLAVTDQRLLLGATARTGLTSSLAEDERAMADIELLRAVPRSAVARARVGWYRLNPKRLRIDFTDGSWLALTVPLAEPGRPLREVASALSG